MPKILSKKLLELKILGLKFVIYSKYFTILPFTANTIQYCLYISLLRNNDVNNQQVTKNNGEKKFGRPIGNYDQ